MEFAEEPGMASMGEEDKKVSESKLNALLLLKLRNAIAVKEWITACANRELSNGGWACNWGREQENIDLEIVDLMDKLEQ